MENGSLQDTIILKVQEKKYISKKYLIQKPEGN